MMNYGPALGAFLSWIYSDGVLVDVSIYMALVIEIPVSFRTSGPGKGFIREHAESLGMSQAGTDVL